MGQPPEFLVLLFETFFVFVGKQLKDQRKVQFGPIRQNHYRLGNRVD